MELNCLTSKQVAEELLTFSNDSILQQIILGNLRELYIYIYTYIVYTIYLFIKS